MASPPGVPADPLDQLTRRRTSTRPPHPPHPTPCPYRAAYVSCCIRSATSIRRLGASVPMGMITPFGWQHSLGLDLAGGEELSSAFEPCLSLKSSITEVC